MTPLAEQIKQTYEAERLSHKKVTQAHEIPGTYEAITPEWLTRILCNDVPGAEVVSYDLRGRDDGTASRRRICLTYNEAGRAAKLPQSVFCKTSDTLSSRINLGVSGAALAEANFYNKVRPLLDLEATRAYYANFDPRTYAHIIVMADLTGQAMFCDERTLVDWDRATRMVTTLAQLHARFYQSPMLGTASLPFKSWPNWWNDFLAAAPLFTQCCAGGFADAESVIPPELFRRQADVWPCTLRSVARHEQLPQTLIHTDVHLKNWYIASDQAMGLGDWQTITIGHWSRDFGYAMTTALSIDNRRRWERDLLQLYLDKLAQLGMPTLSFDEAFLNVRQQLFTALAFWTGTLRLPQGAPPVQPERTALEFIRRLTTAIDDLEALDSFD